MKKIICGSLLLLSIFSLLGCGSGEAKKEPALSQAAAQADNENTAQAVTTVKEQAGEKMSEEITLCIGERKFKAVLADTPAAKALAAELPLDMTMKELNGNEKYCRLSKTLPTKDLWPSKIHAGDFMLYNGNTVVLFYENFTSRYSYTPLGRIESAAGLAEALGKGDVRVVVKR